MTVFSSFKERFFPKDDQPDGPVSFGESCTWLALKTVDTNKVVKTLKLTKKRTRNWSEGIKDANGGLCFVTPPVDGWTLVVSSRQLPLLDGTVGRVHAKRLLELLSITFGEVQYFASYASINVESWARARHGKVGRIFHRTSILLNINEGDAEAGDVATAAAAEIAGTWSINPLTLGGRSDIAPGLGVRGRFLKI